MRLYEIALIKREIVVQYKHAILSAFIANAETQPLIVKIRRFPVSHERFNELPVTGLNFAISVQLK